MNVASAYNKGNGRLGNDKVVTRSRGTKRRCTAAGLTSRPVLIMLAIGGIVALALLFSLHSSGAQTPQLLLQGRVASDYDSNFADTLPVLLSWPASSVYVTFNSDAISVQLSALPVSDSISVYNRFYFSVDQGDPDIETTDTDTTVISWNATGLNSGIHNLTITKVNEAAYGEATLDSITLAPGGR